MDPRRSRRVAAVVVALAGFPLAASALANPITTELVSAKGNLSEASASIFEAGTSVLVNVVGQRIIPTRAAVTLNVGTCEAPGRIAFALARFTGNQSITELKHTTADIVQHARSMVIHETPSETSAVFACGPLPPQGPTQ